jgi:hypothetical protein
MGKEKSGKKELVLKKKGFNKMKNVPHLVAHFRG